MLRANSVSNFFEQILALSKFNFREQFFLTSYCEQIFFDLSDLFADRNCVMRPYLDCK